MLTFHRADKAPDVCSKLSELLNNSNGRSFHNTITVNTLEHFPLCSVHLSEETFLKSMGFSPLDMYSRDLGAIAGPG